MPVNGDSLTLAQRRPSVQTALEAQPFRAPEARRSIIPHESQQLGGGVLWAKKPLLFSDKGFLSWLRGELRARQFYLDYLDAILEYELELGIILSSADQKILPLIFRGFTESKAPSFYNISEKEFLSPTKFSKKILEFTSFLRRSEKISDEALNNATAISSKLFSDFSLRIHSISAINILVRKSCGKLKVAESDLLYLFLYKLLDIEHFELENFDDE